MITEKKQEIIDQIMISIEDLQCDISNELHSDDDIRDIKLDIDSLKTILGHLLTLKSC